LGIGVAPNLLSEGCAHQCVVASISGHIERDLLEDVEKIAWILGAIGTMALAISTKTSLPNGFNVEPIGAVRGSAD
jgi:hypothetical protein